MLQFRACGGFAGVENTLRGIYQTDRRTEECQGWVGGGRRGGGAKPSGAPDNRGAKGGSRRAAGPEPRPALAGCSRPRVLPVSPAPRAPRPAAPAPRALPGGADPAPLPAGPVPAPARSERRRGRGGAARPGRGPPARRGCWSARLCENPGSW